MFDLDAFKAAVKVRAADIHAAQQRKLSLDEWVNEALLNTFSATSGTAHAYRCFLPKRYYQAHWGMTFEEVCQHLRDLGFYIELEDKRKHSFFIGIDGFSQEMQAYCRTLRNG